MAKQKKKRYGEDERAMLPKENGQDLRAHQHQTITNPAVSRGPTRNGGRPRPRPSALRHMRLTKNVSQGSQRAKTNAHTPTACNDQNFGHNGHAGINHEQLAKSALQNPRRSQARRGRQVVETDRFGPRTDVASPRCGVGDLLSSLAETGKEQNGTTVSSFFPSPRRNPPTCPPPFPERKTPPKSHDCGIETLDASLELTEIWIVLAGAETWVRGPAAATPHVCPRRLICRRVC